MRLGVAGFTHAQDFVQRIRELGLLVPASHREPFQKLVDGRARLDVFKQRADRDARVLKDPSAVYFVFGALNSFTISPVQHCKK